MARNGTIKAVFIIEVIGKPAEYLTETLENLTKQIGEEKGVKITNKKINEPKELENKKEFYSNFAEIEIETEEVVNIIVMMFKYMPSHIEIISPENVSLPNSGWNEMLNELTRRLHAYDEIARVMQIERNVLETKLREVLGQNQTLANPINEEIEEEVKETKKPKKAKKNKNENKNIKQS